jgi:hypothetical protein
MLRHKCVRTDGARLLAVRKEHHHIVAEGRTCSQGTQYFQGRDHARAAVHRAWDARRGVIVRHQQHSACWVGPRQADEDILDRSCRHPARADDAEAKALLHLWLQAKGVDLAQQIVTDLCVRRRGAHGMRFASDGRQVLQRPLCRNDGGWRVRRLYWWGRDEGHRHPDGSAKDTKG